MLVAPMAMQCMAHPDGELAVSRAAAGEGICMVRLYQFCGPLSYNLLQQWAHCLAAHVLHATMQATLLRFLLGKAGWVCE